MLICRSLGIVSEAYLAECASFIGSGEKVASGRSGHLEAKHTIHVSYVNENGMIVSLTYTLGNPSGFIASHRQLSNHPNTRFTHSSQRLITPHAVSGRQPRPAWQFST